jgi:hypothetical protein
MNTEYIIGPSTIEVGRMREEIWKSLDRQGVHRGDGVVSFFASEGFKRPEGRENVDLNYITPEKLGFDKPSSLDLIWKEVEMRKMGLEECPMETAVSLLDELKSKTDQTREYYVVSRRQQNRETNEIKVPEFLKLVLRQSGSIDILGWSGKDLLPVNGVLVFKQGIQRVNLTNL